MELIYELVMLIQTRPAELVQHFQEHLWLVLVPMTFAVLVAVPLGILVTRFPLLNGPIFGFANVVQTIPSMALLALMIPLGFGIGFRPAAVAIFLYALLPIVRNTYTGISSVDSSVKEAALGMGMTNWQLLVIVELPLALPVIMAGIRTSLVTSIGVGTIAALIGAGGLGEFITRGLGMVDDALILLGTIPAALLALFADWLIGGVERWITPRGLRG